MHHGFLYKKANKPEAKQLKAASLCAVVSRAAARAAGEWRELQRSHSKWPGPLYTYPSSRRADPVLVGGRKLQHTRARRDDRVLVLCEARPEDDRLRHIDDLVNDVVGWDGVVGGRAKRRRVAGNAWKWRREVSGRAGDGSEVGRHACQVRGHGAVSDERVGQLPNVSGRWTYREGPRRE